MSEWLGNAQEKQESSRSKKAICKMTASSYKSQNDYTFTSYQNKSHLENGLHFNYIFTFAV